MSKRKRPNVHTITRLSGRGRKASMPLAQEVDLGKGYNPWGFQRKLKPDDTAGMVAEEIEVLKFVAEHQPVKLWTVLNHLGRFAGPHKYQSRSQRQKLMPLTTRLCREGKLKRNRMQNTLLLGPNYATIKPDIAEPLQDFCGALRHVSGVGGLVA